MDNKGVIGISRCKGDWNPLILGGAKVPRSVNGCQWFSRFIVSFLLFYAFWICRPLGWFPLHTFININSEGKGGPAWKIGPPATPNNLHIYYFIYLFMSEHQGLRGIEQSQFCLYALNSIHLLQPFSTINICFFFHFNTI